MQPPGGYCSPQRPGWVLQDREEKLPEKEGSLGEEVAFPCSGNWGTRPPLLFPQLPLSDPSTNPAQLPCHCTWPRSPSGARESTSSGTKGKEGALAASTLRQTLGPAWGLRISQSHHNQGHKYAMLLDPVIPLFGIPPKDIIARGKIAICTQLFIATLFIIGQNCSQPNWPVSRGAEGGCVNKAACLLGSQEKWQTQKILCE